jgi:hypothetical protein
MSEYDPKKKYSWDNDTEFKMNGNEFGLILNTFRTILHSPEAQRILLINEANNTIENVLGRNVKEGIVKEVIEEPKESSPLKKVSDKQD